jgi:FkbM family methyltransferase
MSAENDPGILYGEDVLKRLLAYIRADMVFDVGANVGQYALHLRRRLGYGGPIHSFEPIPRVAEQMLQTSRSDPSWKTWTCGIGRRRERRQFNVMLGDQFSSFLDPSAKYAGRFHGQHSVVEVIEVDVITLDDAVRNAPIFSKGLLKLDTQGTELEVLEAEPASIKLFSAIQIEVAFQQIYDGAPGFQDVAAKMTSMGYALCALFPNNGGHFPHLLEMDAVFLKREYLNELA